MAGNGNRLGWNIPFHHSSTLRSSSRKEPPKEFVCQISGSLMADPVIITSGQTFESISVRVCRDLGYLPLLSDGSRPNFANLIPNMAIKMTILHWCDTNGVEHPTSPDYRTIEMLVRSSMADESKKELFRGMAEKPPPNLSHAATEVGFRRRHFYSSSLDESMAVSAHPATPLPLATRPACYSNSSLPEMVSNEPLTTSLTQNPSSHEEEFTVKMTSPEVSEQEESVISLRKLTRTNEEARISLCSPRLLSALQPLILSRYSVVQTNAMAALVNLSLEKVNKVKIVRSGMVPPLIDVLKGGFAESQEHAAGAIFSLSLNDDNKTAIGVLGGLHPLMQALRSDSDRTRHDSALALYHLSLVQSNRVKLVKLGAVSMLLAMLRTNMAGRVILVLCNLAACNEGKSAMLDANAVECLVGMLRAAEDLDSEATRENVVAALLSLSHGSLRFKGLARDAGAEEVLRVVEERGSERAREKAKRMLLMMRGIDGGYEEEDDDCRWDGGGLSRTSYRIGHAGPRKDLYSVNSTEF